MSRRRTLARPRFDDKRPPLTRLEALAQEPGIARSQRMMIRIREELNRTPVPGPWIAAALELAARSVISENAALYLVEIFLECITLDSTGKDPEMLRLSGEMDRVKREHGLAEDEDWLLHQGPTEWVDLNAAWDRRDAEIRVATLRALGHEDLARELEREPDAFSDRSSLGYSEFWGERADEDELGSPRGR